jgi:ABC-type microcin C transport system permease subunit YejB
MRVENMVRWHLTPPESAVVLGAFALVAGLFLYIFIREIRKEKSPLGR